MRKRRDGGVRKSKRTAAIVPPARPAERSVRRLRKRRDGDVRTSRTSAVVLFL